MNVTSEAELEHSDKAVRMLRRAVFVVPFALLPACGPKSDITRSIIGYAQVSSVSALDETRDGFFRALADSGYVRDSTITVLERNAQETSRRSH